VKENIMKKSGVLFAMFLTMGISSAQAHITLERGEAAAGSPYKIVLRVPHGCEGSATTKIDVKLPEGIIAAKPMPKAGWELSIKNGAFARGYSFYHGVTLKEGAREISWSGKLPDEYYDEFVIAAFVAKELAPGPLYFSVKQTCEKGEADWSEIPAADRDAHSLKFPAPALNVTEPHPPEHKH
jgi:uncharacterized protein YcnI